MKKKRGESRAKEKQAKLEKIVIGLTLYGKEMVHRTLKKKD